MIHELKIKKALKVLETDCAFGVAVIFNNKSIQAYRDEDDYNKYILISGIYKDIDNSPEIKYMFEADDKEIHIQNIDTIGGYKYKCILSEDEFIKYISKADDIDWDC